ncbi:thioesterase [Psychrobacter sp. F1192]|uniref:Thioesterase n=1 Tax=Psychrobacter coccoides TaxID=2818440 RepID=A0ABS3NMQ7_9GAMM|nr:thioesterase [Psychrobacter coccoides]MBO1530697.1 thioesterase [Psychrobacter coccoides]
MKAQELDFDDGLFVFETVMRVRNNEIDISQHLTLESLTALLTEAEIRFLYSKGIKDVNADFQILTVTNSQLEVVNRVGAREDLLFELGVEQLTDDEVDIAIKVTRMYDGTSVAKARLQLNLYDYRLNKIVALNKRIKEALGG